MHYACLCVVFNVCQLAWRPLSQPDTIIFSFLLVFNIIHFQFIIFYMKQRMFWNCYEICLNLIGFPVLPCCIDCFDFVQRDIEREIFRIRVEGRQIGDANRKARSWNWNPYQVILLTSFNLGRLQLLAGGWLAALLMLNTLRPFIYCTLFTKFTIPTG